MAPKAPEIFFAQFPGGLWIVVGNLWWAPVEEDPQHPQHLLDIGTGQSKRDMNTHTVSTSPSPKTNPPKIDLPSQGGGGSKYAMYIKLMQYINRKINGAEGGGNFFLGGGLAKKNFQGTWKRGRGRGGGLDPGGGGGLLPFFGF